MNPFLLDVSLLIPLMDTNHVHHDLAHEWFAVNSRNGWSTCPITENAVIRILGAPNYKNGPGSPNDAMLLLREFCRSADHQFWPDDVSLPNIARQDIPAFLAPGQISDIYLLALALAHGGQLATLDKRMQATATGALSRGIHLIGSLSIS